MLPGWLLPVLLAPVVGSFLGVLVVRLPDGRKVALARSECDSCHAVLSARDLVPLLSYVVLGGRCRFCGAPIGRLHPAIELAALLVAITVVAAAGPGRGDAGQMAWLWSGCILGWGMLALAWIDWRCFRLPDVITLPLLLLGLGACALLDPQALSEHAAAAVAGYLAFRAIAWSYRRLRGREGLGAGDAKLLGAGGAWLGLAGLPILVLLAALATLAVAVLSTRGRLGLGAPIPFGPGLAGSAWVLWLWITPLPSAISG